MIHLRSNPDQHGEDELRGEGDGEEEDDGSDGGAAEERERGGGERTNRERAHGANEHDPTELRSETAAARQRRPHERRQPLLQPQPLGVDVGRREVTLHLDSGGEVAHRVPL